MTKIALINPGVDKYNDTPPINLAMLAGYLETKGHDVIIIDKLAGDNFERKLLNFQPDVVGVTATTPVITDAWRCADFCRQMGIYTVMGGVHSSILPEESLKHADAVVVGEGEILFGELCESKAKGIFQGKPVENLDLLPPPAWRLINMEFYTTVLSRSPINFMAFGNKNMIMGNMLTSRGCPWNCNFCLPKGTLILKDDFTWTPIEKLTTKDKLIGISKEKNRRTKTTITEIKNQFYRISSLLKIKTEDGIVFSSPEHPWLTSHNRWKEARNLKVGDILRLISKPIEPPVENEEFMRGYVVGASLGDGTIGHYPFINNKGNSGIMHQYRIVGDDEMIDTVLKYLKEMGFEHIKESKFNGGKIYPNVKRCVRTCKKDEVGRIENWCKNIRQTLDFRMGFICGIYDAEGSYSCGNLRISNKDKNLLKIISTELEFEHFKVKIEENGIIIYGGVKENIRFMATYNPKVKHKKSKLIGIQLNNNSKILKIKPCIGKYEVYNLETMTGNFVADGFVTHNCYNSYRTLPPRYNSAERVIQDLELLIHDYHITGVFFVEDNFFSNPLRVKKICKLMKEHGINIPWGANSRVDCVTEELLDIVKKANCQQVTFGWESGSDRILKVLNKRTTVEMNKRSIRMCNAAGIKASGTFMIGNPTETVKDIEMTKNFIIENDIRGPIGICITTPYPGTGLWEWCVKNRRIPKVFRWEDFDFHHLPIKVTDIPDDKLLQLNQELVNIAIQKFYQNRKIELRMVEL